MFAGIGRKLGFVLILSWAVIPTSHAVMPADDAQNFKELVDQAITLVKGQLTILDTHLQYMEEPDQPRFLYLRNITANVLKVAEKAQTWDETNQAVELVLRSFEGSQITAMALVPRSSLSAYEQLFKYIAELGRLYQKDTRSLITHTVFSAIERDLEALYPHVDNATSPKAKSLAKKIQKMMIKIRKFNTVALGGDNADLYDLVEPVCLDLRALKEPMLDFASHNRDVRALVMEIHGNHDVYIDNKNVRLERRLQKLLRAQLQSGQKPDKE